MFDIFLDYIKRIIKSRVFPIAIIFVILFSVLVNQLFILQIVKGPAIAEDFDFKDTKSREVKSTRGNIYDRNGVLLATNSLSYSVTMDDSMKITSNEQRNDIIHRLIQMIEDNDDTLDNEFYIVQNDAGELEFSVTGSALTRFKKNAYAYVIEDGKFTEELQNSTAAELYEFLKNGAGSTITSMFEISDDYSVEETLKIMSVRYALFLNYPKFMQITVASNVSDRTVASVYEHSAELPGVSIDHQTQRVYKDSKYFAHILGYTGRISAVELEDMNDSDNYYNFTDIIGKTGLEKEYESYLSGKKGSEIVSVGMSDKVNEVIDRINPVAGDDIYLTIDSELQKSFYHILERRITGVFLEKLRPNMDYGTKGESASDIRTPIYEVYYALLNNNIIDINRFDDADAEDLEKEVYKKYQDYLDKVFEQYDSLLNPNSSKNKYVTEDMQDFLDYFYTALVKHDIILVDNIPKEDSTYLSYMNKKTDLSTFLQYAISNNWIDLSKLNVGDDFFVSDEIYKKLVAYTKDVLQNDNEFKKKIYRNLIFSYKITGKEICLLLFIQNVLEYNKADMQQLESGNKSPYEFIKDKLTTLEITPAMLALEPSSGSLVITDVKTGEILAMVSYPSYDNNKLANKVDPDYWRKLNNDLTYPMNNRPTTELLAPGSTFKMITAIAALEEGEVTPEETVRDLGIFEKTPLPAKCHAYPGSHGSVNVSGALKVSCNYYFYEMGYRLSIDSSGKYRVQLGLSKLEKYATLFGLNEKSGVELYEAAPLISTTDPIRSSIGQGTNAYAPVQLSRYITTIANRGTSFDLTLLDKIVDKDGHVILDNQAKVSHDLSDFRDSTWDYIHEGLYRVVNEPSGSVYRLYKDLGVAVAGKTGTSQVSKVDPNNALFVSFAPYEDPKISVTVVIPHGHTSGNAAELARDIYKLYFNLEDKSILTESEVTLPEHNIGAFSD